MKIINHFFKALAFALIVLSCTHNHSDCKRDQKIKGFMIDAARDVEKMDYYYRLIDFFSARGFNTVMFRLTDDEGCAMRYVSHPELITHPGAYTAAQLKELVAYAQSKNIEMIPEVESFGHTKYITKSKTYEYLKDYPNENHWMNAICPVHDTTLKIMKDLYAETAEVFPSCYIHIGCDEVDWGVSKWSKEALKSRTKTQIYASYLNTLNGYIKALGKKTIIWGDVIIHRSDPELLRLLDKDIVIMDWNYWDVSDKKIDSIAHEVLNKGFELIGSPAVNWFAWGPRVGSYQLENLLCFARVYKKIDDPGNLGIIMTHWLPRRYIQNCQWDSYALAADILNNPGEFNFSASLKSFNESFYGVLWNEQWDDFYKKVYDHTPAHRYLNSNQVPDVFNGVRKIKIIPWSSKDYIRDHVITRDSLLVNPFTDIAEKATELEAGITKNKSDFREFVVTLEWISYMIDRDNMLWGLCRNKPSVKEMKQTLEAWSVSDKAWVTRLDTIWVKGRTAALDSIHLWSFPRAAEYTHQLAQNPQLLIDLLKQGEKK